MTEWPRESVDGYRVATLAVALFAGLVALLVATHVFPHYSLNHDEAVYLQQARLLLDGQAFLRPPVEDAFRPWFFVEDGDRLYPKYAPVPAAVFALGELLGEFPLALAGVATVVVGSTAALGRELFDARTGLLAGVFLVASPLFLVQSGVYLPYATTTALNLVFALAYLRAERRDSLPAAAVAGVVVGLAFFSRPYTAVLFAAPFVVHACWTLVRSGAWRSAFGSDGDRALVTRRATTAGLGTAGVVAALAYNWVVTGDPLLFPYQAFAPRDGIGFGHREILGHEVQYTVGLGLRANGQVLRRLFTDWVVAGPLGTALAAGGVLALVRNRDAPDASRRALLAALFVTVAVGNVAFWGNLNALGRLSVANDGLVHFLGPYYHFDLLVPTAVFAAHGALLGVDRLRTTASERFSRVRARRITVAALVVSATVFGAAAVDRAAAPLARNDRVSEELEAGYEPFADGTPADAVVFLPTPYGPWLNHPFQGLRNGPSYDGATVYSLRGSNELAVAAAYPNRTLYRYVYAGSWVPTDDSTVDAALQPVERVEGRSVRLDVSFPRPTDAASVTLRLSTERETAYYVANGSADRLDATVTVDGGRAMVAGSMLSPTGNGTVAVDDTDEVTLEAYVSTGPASGFSYRLTFPVERRDGTVRVLSPTRERCQVPTRCVPVATRNGSAADGLETTFETGNR